MTALAELHAALDDLAHRGRTWPCHGRTEWVSDDTRDRALAARHCHTCPVLDICWQAALEIQPDAGVWAGQPYGQPGRAPRKGQP
jgi:hypothetical protein